MRFLQVFRGYVRVTSCKTSKIAYVHFIVEHVIQLIIMSTMGKPNAPGGSIWLYFFLNNYACVFPMFERADIFISDAVYNNLKLIFRVFCLSKSISACFFTPLIYVTVGSEDRLMSSFKNRW